MLAQAPGGQASRHTSQSLLADQDKEVSWQGQCVVVLVVVDTLDLSPERANPNWPFPHCAAAAVQALLHLHELALLRKRWRLSQGAKEMFLAKPLVKVGCVLACWCRFRDCG